MEIDNPNQTKHDFRQEIHIMQKIISCVVATGFGFLIAVSGCGKSDSSTSTSSNGSSQNSSTLSPIEQEAQNAALGEIQKHFAKNADGWITARTSGSPYAPEHFLRQIRDILIDQVSSNTPTDSDKLNGVDWSGQVTFKPLACREAGDAGMLLDGLGDISPSRQPGQWTPWAQYQPEVLQLQKVKGQWQVDTNTWILHGTIPTPADYAKAGVK